MKKVYNKNMKENIKDQILKIKNTDQRSKIFKFLFVILIFAFLSLNFISSQTISPLYSKLVNNDKVTIISFLEKIKNFPEYQKILGMNNNIYGKTVEEEILKQENQKKEMIKNLEQKLNLNPKARDVLYSLYQLNLAEGNINQASDYLRRAKKIDPSIN